MKWFYFSLAVLLTGFLFISLNNPEVVEVRKVIEKPIYIETIIVKKVPFETVVYRYPNTPPYEAFPDPIDFNQALILLQGMRASHEQALNWTFQGSPGFGIDDREFQLEAIRWYDQLIDFIWRQKK